MPRSRLVPPPLLVARVTRWGKFWSLEPLFADERHYLVARGGRAPHLDEIVLALPAKGNRMRITEVLGTAADPEAVLRALLHAERIAQEFPTAVLAEASAATARRDLADDGRVNLTGLATFTIDPDTARDFDDAISVQRESGGYRVHVHIADVSYFVDAGGAIDGEARRRTASVYLPLFAVPMLPEALSADVCSLKPQEERKCVTVEFTFDAAGARTSVAFYRSTIRSDHRLTYGYVDRVLDGGEAGGEGADGALAARLRLAHELAQLLRRRRFSRGALQIASFEPEFFFDERGELVGADRRPESDSHALVEEFMLAANEAVAEFLLRRGAGTIYRVHEPPDPASVDALFAAMEDLEVPAPPLPVGEKATAAQVAGALRRLSELLPKLSAREGRGRLAFPSLLLRSLKQARYWPENLGHFGLASACYLHFTSPIRRYPDLVAHRALLHRLGGGGHELSPGDLLDVADACSLAERAIARLELVGDDVALAFLLERRLLEEGWDTAFPGEIVGIIEGGLFVQFGGTFEGYVPARSLPDDYYRENELGTAYVGQRTGRRYRLGDPILVCAVRVDRLSGKIELAPAGKERDRDDPRPPAGPARRAGRPATARRRPGKHGLAHRGR